MYKTKIIEQGFENFLKGQRVNILAFQLYEPRNKVEIM